MTKESEVESICKRILMHLVRQPTKYDFKIVTVQGCNDQGFAYKWTTSTGDTVLVDRQ